MHSPAVSHSLDTFFGRTIGTAVEDTVGFYPMTNNLAPAMMTSRSQGRNRTFEAVEDMRLPTHEDLKGFIVVIATSFTLCHPRFSFAQSILSYQPAFSGRILTWVVPCLRIVFQNASWYHDGASLSLWSLLHESPDDVLRSTRLNGSMTLLPNRVKRFTHGTKKGSFCESIPSEETMFSSAF